jgi:lyso-ornithine lipid O-acyltransferase
VFFPEGTSTDGSKVLPFHSSLFEAAVGNGDLIQAAQISYVAEDGDAGTDVCYWGDMTLATHLWKLFGLRRVHARVRFGPAAKYADRKTAAVATRQSVLALTGSD